MKHYGRKLKTMFIKLLFTIDGNQEVTEGKCYIRFDIKLSASFAVIYSFSNMI